MNTTKTASITVRVGRDTIDPQGIGSDEDVASCTEYVLDAVRAEWPDAEVDAVGNGGRTSAVDDDGHDFTADVKRAVNAAFDAWCASGNLA